VPPAFVAMHSATACWRAGPLPGAGEVARAHAAQLCASCLRLLVLHVLLLLVPCSTGKVSPHGSLMPPGALQADLWQPGAVIGSSANAKVNMPVLGWRS
jgi:hypothetical protein